LRIRVHTADATRLDSFVSSASAVCIGLKPLPVMLLCVVLLVLCTMSSDMSIRLWPRPIVEWNSPLPMSNMICWRPSTAHRHMEVVGGTQSAPSGVRRLPLRCGSALLMPAFTVWRGFVWWSSCSDPSADHYWSTAHIHQKHRTHT